MEIKGKRTLISALSVVSAIVLSISGCKKTSAEPPIALRTEYVMSTTFTVQLTGPDAEEAADAAVEAIARCDREFSRFDESSEIYLINENAGKGKTRISEETYSLLSVSLEYAERSGGAFDVTIEPLTSLWNISGEHPSVPSDEDIELARSRVGYRGLILESAVENGEKRYYASLGEGCGLDLGGIAKGYALDDCRKALEAFGADGFLSLGGNVLVVGEKEGGPFTVGVRVPEKDSGGYVCALALNDAIVSTTGGYERFFVENGVTYHHVLDPASGRPADTDLLSVSVVEENGARADFLSTWLYIEGLAGAKETAKKLGLAVVLVDADNNVYISSALENSVAEGLSDTENYTFIYF